VNRIDDERLLFYLERKEHIDRWAEIRKDEATAVDQLCTALEPDVASLASELGCLPFSDVIGGTSMVGLHRDWWQVGDERPAALVAVAWFNSRSSASKRASFTDPGLAPWVGVRTRRSGLYEESTAVLTPLLARASVPTFTDSDGPRDTWPVYAWAPKHPDIGWSDLNGYRRHLLDLLAKAWEVFSATIDETLIAPWKV
jgi:hypothetical protein